MEKIPFRKPLMLIVGCLLCSIATNWVAIPNGFAVTGVTGLSMTLSKFIGVNYALIYYGITLLILFITWLTLGKKDMSNIVILSVMYPAVLWILNLVDIKIIFQEKLIAVACFGVINGLGAGIPYRLGYSYGGSDTLAKILKKCIFKTTDLKNVMLAIECAIMLIMLTAFSLDIVAYSFVGELIFINCMNHIVFNLGPKLYEVQLIGTDMGNIEDFIINKIQKSVTIANVIGGYTRKEKIQMDCVCNSKEYIQLRNFIKNEKSDCFIKVVPLVHVFGENKDFHKLNDENIE